MLAVEQSEQQSLIAETEPAIRNGAAGFCRCPISAMQSIDSGDALRFNRRVQLRMTGSRTRTVTLPQSGSRPSQQKVACN